VGLPGSGRPGELDMLVLPQRVQDPGRRQAPLSGHERQRDQFMQVPRAEVPEGPQVAAHPVLRGGLARPPGRRLAGIGQVKHANQRFPVDGAPARVLAGGSQEPDKLGVAHGPDLEVVRHL
jgi:hypothetical protein